VIIAFLSLIFFVGMVLCEKYSLLITGPSTARAPDSAALLRSGKRIAQISLFSGNLTAALEMNALG